MIPNSRNLFFFSIFFIFFSLIGFQAPSVDDIRGTGGDRWTALGAGRHLDANVAHRLLLHLEGHQNDRKSERCPTFGI